jgi:hypothetical protein
LHVSLSAGGVEVAEGVVNGLFIVERRFFFIGEVAVVAGVFIEAVYFFF